ncbi:sugar phosphate isomerase/epimerase family protein [Arthrobacter burdickii]|uniref:Sugar phosphate isomerase/epimerase n=1 Tax=Arthrobacter burdickii TaxID=3035920 RepID=A0ABT8JYI0_9MICC|nr:sugar phosphate isomerase/epimerase [Arthrobacter burdickii]MDN4610235.1 sugar phosphate isomerase/epimerase [Arthrobacter burdickii]
MFHPRVVCSSISFRHQDLPTALRTVQGLGFTELDLGALPGVCNHVPFVLDTQAVDEVASEVLRSGLRVRSVNGDIGDLNARLTPVERTARTKHLDMLLALASAIGAAALVLPCGAPSHDPLVSFDEDLDLIAAALGEAADRAAAAGVEIWVEAPHFFRLCWDIDRARHLLDRVPQESVGLVMDFSHIVASGGDPVEFVRLFSDRIRHVHLRDAVPGNINLSIGNGQVDFAAGFRALSDAGYQGRFALELETRDVTDDQRPDATAAAARFISRLLSDSTSTPHGSPALSAHHPN